MPIAIKPEIPPFDAAGFFEYLELLDAGVAAYKDVGETNVETEEMERAED
jgi:hypothetical protein